MNDPADLYRQAKLAQARAEQGRFDGTAAALAAIAEMIVLEAGLSAAMVEQHASEPAPSTPSARPAGTLPTHSQVRC